MLYDKKKNSYTSCNQLIEFMKTLTITCVDNPDYLAYVSFNTSKLESQWSYKINCQYDSSSLPLPYLYIIIKDEYDIGENLFTPDDNLTLQLVASDKETQDAIDAGNFTLPANSQGIVLSLYDEDSIKFGDIAANIHSPSTINLNVIISKFTKIPEYYKITFDISQIEKYGNNTVTGGEIESITIPGDITNTILQVDSFSNYLQSLNFSIVVNYVMSEGMIITGLDNIDGPYYTLDIIDTKTGELVMSIDDKFYPSTMPVPVPPPGLSSLTLTFNLLQSLELNVEEIKKKTKNHQLTLVFKNVIFPPLSTEIVPGEDPDTPVPPHP